MKAGFLQKKVLLQLHFWIKFFERLQTKQISSDVLLSLLKSQKEMLFTYTLTVLYRHDFYHSLSSKVTLEINLTSTFAAKIGPKNSFLLYSKILFIALNIDWDFHIFLSSIMKFKQLSAEVSFISLFISHSIIQSSLNPLLLAITQILFYSIIVTLQFFLAHRSLYFFLWTLRKNSQVSISFLECLISSCSHSMLDVVLGKIRNKMTSINPRRRIWATLLSNFERRNTRWTWQNGPYCI